LQLKANSKITEDKNAQAAHAKLSPGFESPLFGCLSEGPLPCLVACCCPGIVNGMITAQMDNNRECTPFDCLCATSTYELRQRIRTQYNVEYAPLQDFAITCLPCFNCCTTHQTAMEWKRRSSNEPDFMKMPDRYL